MKDTFVLTTKYLRQMERLTMEQRGLLITSIMLYEDGEELPEMDAVTGLAFDWIRADLDDNRKKYEEQCRKNSNNAKKATASDRIRPQATASETQRPQATASDRKRNALDSDSDYECDFDSDSEYEHEKKRESREKKPRFSPPSLDQVVEECKAKGYTFDPEKFMAYYESNGWKVGRNPMKDWKAAARNWQTRENKAPPEKPPEKNKYTPKGEYFNFDQRKYDFNALEKAILTRQKGEKVELSDFERTTY